MTERTCTVDGCDKAHRARGYCNTHYKQAHPDKSYAKVTVPCDACGTPCVKDKTSRYVTRYCSYACRSKDWLPGNSGHCRVYFPTCLVCEQRFSTRKPGTFCCSTSCWDTAVRMTAPPRPPTAPPKWRDTECAWCSTRYRTNQPSRAYCSKRCSTRAARLRRRAREAGAHGSYSWAEFMRIAHRFDYRCAYCNEKPDEQLDPDHVVPLSRGGSNSTTNLLPACRACNCDKRDLLLHEWLLDRERRHLPPRMTTWAPEDRRFWHLTDTLLAA